MLLVMLILNRTEILVRLARDFRVILVGCSHTYFVLMGLHLDLLKTLPLGSELCLLIASKKWEGMTGLVARTVLCCHTANHIL